MAATVDSGDDIEKLLDAVKKTGSQLEQIGLTHAHIDHAPLPRPDTGACGVSFRATGPSALFALSGRAIRMSVVREITI